jgi:ATP-binding cassette subfamily F protein 3
MTIKQPAKPANQPCILSAYQLAKAYNIYPVFGQLTFQLNQGEKIALVGVNGAGKSTLLKILAGEEQPDSGQLTTSRDLKIGYLPQDAMFVSDCTLYEEMRSVFEEVRLLQEEIGQLEQAMAQPISSARQWDEMMEKYATLTQQFELQGGYEYEVQIQKILNGLNFGPEWWSRPLSQLSGGQKTRALLARTLLSEPDLLLLDEPTNHLDLTTLEWLENFLSEWPGTIVVISHDRVFLDRVVTRVLDLSFGRLEDYPGNYTTYLKLKAQRQERALKEYEAQQTQIARTEEFIRRYRAGSRARQARGRETRLAHLSRLEKPAEQAQLRLSRPEGQQSGRIVLTIKDLEIGWQTENDLYPLFQIAKAQVERGERIAILGPNGSGKSTFLRTLVGELPPLTGHFEYGQQVKVGYYAQGHEGLNLENCVLTEIRQTQPISEEEARRYLGRFLFSGDNVFKVIGALSGGERSRVALAKLILSKPNLLILDEPTNHLDLSARQALEALLQDYEGTLLFVSHDRYFINALATQIWEVSKFGLTVFRGNYQDYQEWLEHSDQYQPLSVDQRNKPELNRVSA